MSNSDSQLSVRRRAPIPKSDCALAQAVEQIGDRWSLLILREAFFGVMRYDDIRQDIGIPRAMLTDRLSRLMSHGLLDKIAYQEPGDRKRNGYVLTDKGRGLAVSLIALTQWSETYILRAPGPVAIVDGTSGKPVAAGLVDEDGVVVSPNRAEPRVREIDPGDRPSDQRQ